MKKYISILVLSSLLWVSCNSMSCSKNVTGIVSCVYSNLYVRDKNVSVSTIFHTGMSQYVYRIQFWQR